MSQASSFTGPPPSTVARSRYDNPETSQAGSFSSALIEFRSTGQYPGDGVSCNNEFDYVIPRSPSPTTKVSNAVKSVLEHHHLIKSRNAGPGTDQSKGDEEEEEELRIEAQKAMSALTPEECDKLAGELEDELLGGDDGISQTYEKIRGTKPGGTGDTPVKLLDFTSKDEQSVGRVEELDDSEDEN